MKHLKLILFTLFLATFFSGNAQQVFEEKDTSTTLQMDRMEHHFDTIVEGDSVVTSFKVKNTGTYDLYIRQIFPSCGCSVVDFKQTAIKIGEEIEVKVVFNSLHKEGVIENTFQMFSNAGFHTFFLKGYVIKAAQ